MLDFIIKNGTVIDGTGADARRADVGVHNGRIVLVGDLHDAQAAQVIDAGGRVVAPGFIDSHSHADISVIRTPDLESLTAQGITTVCTGHCGMGLAPLNRHYMGMFNDEEALNAIFPPLFAGDCPGRVPVVELEPLREAYLAQYGIPLDWSSFDEFLAHIEHSGVGPNLVPFVPHGPLRIAVMGVDFRRAATDREVSEMCSLLRQSMDAGAHGLSFGFDYQPGDEADKNELLALMRVVAEYDGIVTAHAQYSPRRGSRIIEGFQPIDGYREMLELGLESGARVHISHLRPGYRGMPAPELTDESCRSVMRLFEAYRAQGVRAGWDVLPHYAEAGHYAPMLASQLLPYVEQCGSLTRFQAMLHLPEYRLRLKYELENGLNPGSRSAAGLNAASPGWHSVYEITQCALPGCTGRTIGELAQKRGQPPLDTLLDLLADDVRVCVRIRVPLKSPLGLDCYASYPDAAFGLDVGGCNFDCQRETRPDMPPRYDGAYSDFCGMVMLLTCGVIGRREDIIAAITGRTARNYGLLDRGQIAEGMRADLVILDWDALDPGIDYITPNRPPRGVDMVFVNGHLTAEKGRMLNPRAGMVVRRRQIK